MLVHEVMTPNPVTIDAEMSVNRAVQMMKEQGIRHLPVIDKKKGMIGLVTRESLNRSTPSELTTLSIWEINYQLSKIKIPNAMVKKVFTTTEDATVEEAARLMIENKIGGLPVLREGELVGIVTEVDLLGALTSMMGWRQPGVRVTVQVNDEEGQLAKVATAIAEAGGLLVGGGSYQSKEPLKANIVFKVRNVPMQELKDILSELEQVDIIDLRDS
jgi:acetoin utilization protein AcuB